MVRLKDERTLPPVFATYMPNGYTESVLQKVGAGRQTVCDRTPPP